MSALYTKISEAAAEQQKEVERSQAKAANNTKAETVPDVTGSAKSQPDRTGKPNGRTDQPNGSSVRTDDATVDAPESANGRSQDSGPAAVSGSLLNEMQNGVDDNKRPTERYSFEIYADQKDTILEIQYRYVKRTGKRLSKSRIIREALDLYFDQALTTE